MPTGFGQEHEAYVLHRNQDIDHTHGLSTSVNTRRNVVVTSSKGQLSTMKEESTAVGTGTVFKLKRTVKHGIL